MKAYIFKTNYLGNDLYWANDDVEGDTLVLDVNAARIFSEKAVNQHDLDNAIINSEIYCPDLGVDVFVRNITKIEI